jgi:hypothetical protein
MLNYNNLEFSKFWSTQRYVRAKLEHFYLRQSRYSAFFTNPWRIRTYSQRTPIILIDSEDANSILLSLAYVVYVNEKQHHESEAEYYLHYRGTFYM